MTTNLIRLDLNNQNFQKKLFKLQKADQVSLLRSLRKLSRMSWEQVYSDHGLNWEMIHNYQGSKGEKCYSFRVNQSFRAIAYRDETWLRIISLHPDHDSAYQ